MVRTSACDSVFSPDIGDTRLTPVQALSRTTVQSVQYSRSLTIGITVRHLANQFDILYIGRFANSGSWFLHFKFAVATALPMNDEVKHLRRIIKSDDDFLNHCPDDFLFQFHRAITMPTSPSATDPSNCVN